eukprot:gene2611-16400_t
MERSNARRDERRRWFADAEQAKARPQLEKNGSAAIDERELNEPNERRR